MGIIYNYFYNYFSVIFANKETQNNYNYPSTEDEKHIQYLYEFKIKDNDDDFYLKKTDSKIELNIEESNIINESKKRKIYKGKIDNVKDCVIKTYKKNNGEIFYTNNDLVNDLINLFKAKKLSEKYSEKYHNDTEFVPMNFVDFYIGSNEEKSTDELKGILSNENSKNSEIDEGLNLIENFIDRKKFITFVDEYCHVNYTDSKNIPLFMHWTWLETNGTFLVCDLRGEINENNKGYELSSPSLQSKDKIYGNSDNGVYSLITFIAEHKHSEQCKNLPWPDDKNIELAKKLKGIYNSSNAFEIIFGHKDFYDDIFSSAFNNNNNLNYFLAFYAIIIVIIAIIVFNIIKKIFKNPYNSYNVKDKKIELSLITSEKDENSDKNSVYSTEENKKPFLIG